MPHNSTNICQCSHHADLPRMLSPPQAAVRSRREQSPAKHLLGILTRAGSEEMPAWMASLLRPVADAGTPLYVRQFLVKALLHVDKRAADAAAADAAAAAAGQVLVETRPLCWLLSALTVVMRCGQQLTCHLLVVSHWLAHGLRAYSMRWCLLMVLADHVA
jgi:hypothetical protein